MTSIKVAVRVRPFTEKEIQKKARCIIKMEGTTTLIRNPRAMPGGPNIVKSFNYDHSYWSHTDESDSNFATQRQVYQDFGIEMLEHAFEGYNVCIFAYGQTGSGKSYTMMGHLESDQKGIIPQMCENLFERIDLLKQTQSLKATVEVSFMEIFNEKVRDLLNPKNKNNLKIRENPISGPYVEDLSKLLVNNYIDIDRQIYVGNKARTIAATNMNETSSRSHAVFKLIITQKRLDSQTDSLIERVSQISLVDLAGSERVDSTGAQSARLKEGVNINKSLSALGNVISTLAENSKKLGISNLKKLDYIPYRDSVLTWLLKENLGGNSKTALLAAISPADINYDETLSTLRFADRAKQIVCKAIVNEDSKVKKFHKIVFESEPGKSSLTYKLNDSTSMLNLNMISSPFARFKSENSPCNFKSEENEEVLGLKENQKLMEKLMETYEIMLKKTQNIIEKRESALTDLGITNRDISNAFEIYSPKMTPYLVNLNQSHFMSDRIIHYIKEGITRVGRLDASTTQDILLTGENILSNHCILNNKFNELVELKPCNGAICYVNGKKVEQSISLRNSDLVILGNNHVFSFNYSEQVHKQNILETSISTLSSSMTIPDCITKNDDWERATHELKEKQGIDIKHEIDRLLALDEQYKQEIKKNKMYKEQLLEFKSKMDEIEKRIELIIENESKNKSLIQNSVKQRKLHPSCCGFCFKRTDTSKRIKPTKRMSSFLNNNAKILHYKCYFKLNAKLTKSSKI